METTLDINLTIFPIGKFELLPKTPESTKKHISDLRSLPSLLEKTLAEISEKNMDFSYRKDGWSIRQIVHHLADSHLIMYSRIRNILSEETPIVQPFDENKWAELHDSVSLHPSVSVLILKGIHQRATTLLESLSDESFNRDFFHPKYKKVNTLYWLVNIMAWHGKHHVGQIINANQNQLK